MYCSTTLITPNTYTVRDIYPTTQALNPQILDLRLPPGNAHICARRTAHTSHERFQALRHRIARTAHLFRSSDTNAPFGKKPLPTQLGIERRRPFVACSNASLVENAGASGVAFTLRKVDHARRYTSQRDLEGAATTSDWRRLCAEGDISSYYGVSAPRTAIPPRSSRILTGQ